MQKKKRIVNKFNYMNIWRIEEQILGMRDRIDQQLPINEENNVKNYKFLNMAAVISQPGGCEMYLRLKE